MRSSDFFRGISMRLIASLLKHQPCPTHLHKKTRLRHHWLNLPLPSDVHCCQSQGPSAHRKPETAAHQGSYDSTILTTQTMVSHIPWVEKLSRWCAWYHITICTMRAAENFRAGRMEGVAVLNLDSNRSEGSNIIDWGLFSWRDGLIS